MMTTEQAHLIRESFPGIAVLAAPVVKLFYGRLFDLAPEVRPLFRQDIEVQGRKLMDMLTLLVDNLNRFEELAPMLKALGQRHAAYGVKDAHYAILSAALIWAFGIALEDEFSPELKSAWQTLIEAVGNVMRAGAAELQPR